MNWELKVATKAAFVTTLMLASLDLPALSSVTFSGRLRAWLVPLAPPTSHIPDMRACEEPRRATAQAVRAMSLRLAKESGMPDYGVEAIWRKSWRHWLSGECRGCLSSAQSTTGCHGSGSERIPRHEFGNRLKSVCRRSFTSGVTLWLTLIFRELPLPPHARAK